MLIAARSKAQVFGCSLAGIAGSNPAGGIDACLLRVLCAVQGDVSAKCRSLVQRSPTERVCVIQCDQA